MGDTSSNGKRLGGGKVDVGNGLTAPALSKSLINRANAAGTVVDFGDSTAREYAKNAKEIGSFDLSKEEKQNALKELHSLTENQLRAESKAVNPYTSGVARFNKTQVDKNSASASNARQKTKNYMDGLRKQNATKKKETANKRIFNAANAAIKSGALSFTVDGETYTRKTRRAKSFTKQ